MTLYGPPMFRGFPGGGGGGVAGGGGGALVVEVVPPMVEVVEKGSWVELQLGEYSFGYMNPRVYSCYQDMELQDKHDLD